MGQEAEGVRVCSPERRGGGGGGHGSSASSANGGGGCVLLAEDADLMGDHGNVILDGWPHDMQSKYPCRFLVDALPPPSPHDDHTCTPPTTRVSPPSHVASIPLHSTFPW